jgi:hypothetical protein
MLVPLLGLEDGVPLESALSSEPDPLTLPGNPLDHLEVVLPPRIAEPLTLGPADVGGLVLGDASTPGTTVYLLTVDEASLNNLVWGQIFPEEPGGDRYRELEIDLQPRGMVLYGSVDLGLRWQRMGLLLVQDEGELTLSPAGIVLDQELYALPEDGGRARGLLPARRWPRQALNALSIVGPLPGDARVDVARFRRDRLEILASSSHAGPAPLDTGWQLLEPGVELRRIDVAADSERPTERLWIIRLDPARVEFRVLYDPVNPKPVSAWATESRPLLVLNGGYFALDDSGRHEAIGLVVSDGLRWGTPLGDYAGMLAVTTGGDVSVRWLRRQPYDSAEPLSQAVQSFPMLVTPGGVVGFPANADEGAPARRTVVAEDRGGNILLIVAPRGYLSLHELAAFLAGSDLGVDVALNLDGGGSTGVWMAAGDSRTGIDSITPVPSVVIVERR